MAKKSSSAAAPKAAALTAEELQKLSPEEQVALITKLQSENSELKASIKVAKVLPSFEVNDEEEETDKTGKIIKAAVEGGEYQFTCPTFHWDDNTIIDVYELMADAESDDKKVAEKAASILAGLVSRHSGIVKRKED